jgi:hypothetical protein
MADTLTAEELRTMLVTILAGATGVSEGEWDRCLGQLVRVDLTRSPTSNWKTRRIKKINCDRTVIRTAVALAHREHPYVRW